MQKVTQLQASPGEENYNNLAEWQAWPGGTQPDHSCSLMYDSRGTLPSPPPQEYNNDCTLCVCVCASTSCVSANCMHTGCVYMHTLLKQASAGAAEQGVMFPVMSNTGRRLGIVFVIRWRPASSLQAAAEHRGICIRILCVVWTCTWYSW